MTEFEKAQAILKEASRSGSRLGLERIYELASLLGDPQDKLKIVHVAGTNGKGSFCAMLASVLCAQGYKTGMFSSPFMLSENDCIRINGKPVSEKIFAEGIFKAYAASEKMRDKPTEFELLTAAAFLILSEQGCEYAVIECGMGGDGDSTNIIRQPLLSVITNVSLDHCAFLGNTVSEIASHKAGIIKPGVPVFFGDDDKEAFELINRTAEYKGSELYTSDSYHCPHLDENGISLEYKGRKYSVPLFGNYQYKNLVSVLCCIDILRSLGIVLDEEAVDAGLSEVRWEGRFEKLSSDPVIIFDGAHNYAGMEYLCSTMVSYFKGVKPAILIGVLSDKDYPSYVAMLRPLVRRAFTVSPNNPRALDSKVLADVFNSSGLDSAAYPSIHSGFTAAYNYCSDNKCPLVVIGSLYMYKDIVNEIKNSVSENE